MDIFIDFAEFTYDPQEWDWFADGGWETWFEKYPQLFDADDAQILETQARMPDGKRYKYFECHAAVLLYE